MPNPITISSFCVRQLLGPIHMVVRTPDGSLAAFRPNMPGLSFPEASISILDLPGLVRKELGFDTLEICQFHIPENTPSYLERLKEALGEAGVGLANMPVDIGNISDTNPAYREEDLARIEEWFRAAATLGSAMVRVNASGFGGTVAPLEVTVESYRRLGEAAAALGMQLLIENHGGITDDPEVIVRLVEAVGPSRLKVLLDVANFPLLRDIRTAVREGREPDTDVEIVYRQIERLAPYAGFVHVKTGEFEIPWKPAFFDVARALRATRATGYAGTVSIESVSATGDVWENARQLKSVVAEVFA